MKNRNTKKNPLVSVITPVFNGEKCIERAVKCVSMQNVELEHIIVDDCSTDSTPHVLSRLLEGFDHIISIRLNENKGPSVARDIALNSARGRYIAFLDADDVWLPDKLCKQIAFMQNLNCVMTYTDYRYMSEAADLVGPVVRGPQRLSRDMHFMTRSGLACLTVMIDRDKIKNWNFNSQHEGWAVAAVEDFWAWAKLLESVNFAYRVPYDLARYTITPGSRSSAPFFKARVVWNVYRVTERLSILKAILFFTVYLISATWKRLSKMPLYKLESVDSDIDPKWLQIVRPVCGRMSK